MSVFHTVTTYKNGRIVKHNHKTGAGHMTLDQFKQWIQDTDMFPGAAKIEVSEIGYNPANALDPEHKDFGSVSPTSTVQVQKKPQPLPNVVAGAVPSPFTPNETLPPGLRGSPLEAAQKDGKVAGIT